MAWVTSYLCIVTERNYPAMEVGGVWDIDAAMVVEEAITFLPFRKSERAGG